jgi:hypothetical protein
MSNEELQEHLQYIDGVMLAQSLALNTFLRQQPLAAVQLRDYFMHLKEQDEYKNMPQVKRDAMNSTLASFLGPA